MKRFSVFLCLALALTACAKAPEVTELPARSTDETAPAPTVSIEPIGDGDTFLLSSLPDIGSYRDGSPERWYEGYTPELIPRDDYGTLLPYAGERKMYYESDTGVGGDYAVDSWRYGLCTEEGVVVTDPFYDSIAPAAPGQYLMRAFETSSDDPLDGTRLTAWIAAADGSYCTKVYEGTGYVHHVGEGVYTSVNYSWEANAGQTFFTCEGGRMTAVLEDYSGIYYDKGYFCGWDKNNDSVILDSSFNEVAKSEHSVEIANGEYYIFSSYADGKRISGVARLGSGKVVLEPEYEYLGYAGVRFYAYDGESLTVFDDDMKKISSFSVPNMWNVYSEDGVIFTCSDLYYDASCYTADGTLFSEDEHSYDYASGYHIFNSEQGARVYDGSLNELCFIPGERLYSAAPTEGGLLVSSYDSDVGAYIYRPDTKEKEPVHQILDGIYTVALDKENEEPQLLQVYSQEGTPLFRSYGAFTYMGTETERLYGYVSGGKTVTCRENGETLVTFPAHTYG